MTDRLTNWVKNQFSLEQPEQDLLSAETGGDVALGMLPGVGQAMALRDIERARRAGDPAGMALAAAGLVPFGKLLGKLRNKQQLILGGGAEDAPKRMLAKGRDLFQSGAPQEDIFGMTRTHTSPDYFQKWRISDLEAQIPQRVLDQAAEGEWSGTLGEALRHPRLYKHHPEFKEMGAHLALGSPGPFGAGGQFSKEGNWIAATRGTPEELMDTLLHEVQHKIQSINPGWSRGNSPEHIDRVMKKLNRLREIYPQDYQWAKYLDTDTMRKYQDNIGEVEARIPGKMLRAGPEALKITPAPWYQAQPGGVMWSEKSPKGSMFDLDLSEGQVGSLLMALRNAPAGPW